MWIRSVNHTALTLRNHKIFNRTIIVRQDRNAFIRDGNVPDAATCIVGIRISVSPLNDELFSVKYTLAAEGSRRFCKASEAEG